MLLRPSRGVGVSEGGTWWEEESGVAVARRLDAEEFTHPSEGRKTLGISRRRDAHTRSSGRVRPSSSEQSDIVAVLSPPPMFGPNAFCTCFFLLQAPSSPIFILSAVTDRVNRFGRHEAALASPHRSLLLPAFLKPNRPAPVTLLAQTRSRRWQR